MQLFICWSGERSLAIGEALREWLQEVIPGLKPFLSTSIPKGASWSESLEKELRKAKAILACFTADNLESPWMHFEIGAVTRASGRNRAFAYLVGVESKELTGFPNTRQTTQFEMEETVALARALAREMKGTDVDQIEERARQYWPDLEERIRLIPYDSVEACAPGFRSKFDRRTFDVPVHECHDRDWLARYEGTQEAYSHLERYEAAVTKRAGRFAADAYRALKKLVKAYQSDMKGLVLGTWRPGLELDQPLESNLSLFRCEERRLRIRFIAQVLSDPANGARLDVAFQFEESDHLQRKAMIARLRVAIRQNLRNGLQGLGRQDVDKCAVSPWRWDRIAAYQVWRESGYDDLERLVNQASDEILYTRALPIPELIAIHHALDPLENALERNRTRGMTVDAETDKLERVLNDLEQLIKRSRREAEHRREQGIAEHLLRPLDSGGLVMGQIEHMRGLMGLETP